MQVLTRAQYVRMTELESTNGGSMRISKALAIAATGCALTLTAASMVPASAGPSHRATPSVKTKQFPSKVHPKTVHEGDSMTLKGHGAKKKTQYECVQVVIKGKHYGDDASTIMPVTSTKKGHVTCTETFNKFTEHVAGKGKHSCPLSKKDKNNPWKCGFAASTIDQKSATISYFHAKK
jgi:hypothetical protein